MIKQRIILFMLVLFSCGLSVNSVRGLGMEEFGDRPIEISCEWYDGVAAVVKSRGRVYSRWVNGGEIFCYRSDTKAFNEVLKKFAAISAPRRRLIIRNEAGSQKSFYAKEICFDWKLEVVGGISRIVLLNEKGMKAEELYPSITVFLGSGNIQLDKLAVPAGIDVVISKGVEADAKLEEEVKKAKKWQQAFVEWRRFIDPYLREIRKEDSDPSIGYVEIRSTIISETLSRYRIYAIGTRKFKRPSLFAVSADAEITDLSKGGWSQGPDDQYITHPALVSFLREQSIVVSDGNMAISIAKLFEDLSTASERVFDLKFSTANLSIFDKRLYRSICREEDWDYSPEKQENIRVVTKNYVSKKDCRAYTRKFRIILDEKDRFKEIWRTAW